MTHKITFILSLTLLITNLKGQKDTSNIDTLKHITYHISFSAEMDVSNHPKKWDRIITSSEIQNLAPAHAPLVQEIENSEYVPGGMESDISREGFKLNFQRHVRSPKAFFLLRNRRTLMGIGIYDYTDRGIFRSRYYSNTIDDSYGCLLYTSPSPRDA